MEYGLKGQEPRGLVWAGVGKPSMVVGMGRRGEGAGGGGGGGGGARLLLIIIIMEVSHECYCKLLRLTY